MYMYIEKIEKLGAPGYILTALKESKERAFDAAWVQLGPAPRLWLAARLTPEPALNPGPSDRRSALRATCAVAGEAMRSLLRCPLPLSVDHPTLVAVREYLDGTGSLANVRHWAREANRYADTAADTAGTAENTPEVSAHLLALHTAHAATFYAADPQNHFADAVANVVHFAEQEGVPLEVLAAPVRAYLPGPTLGWMGVR